MPVRLYDESYVQAEQLFLGDPDAKWLIEAFDQNANTAFLAFVKNATPGQIEAFVEIKKFYLYQKLYMLHTLLVFGGLSYQARYQLAGQINMLAKGSEGQLAFELVWNSLAHTPK